MSVAGSVVYGALGLDWGVMFVCQGDLSVVDSLGCLVEPRRRNPSNCHLKLA